MYNYVYKFRGEVLPSFDKKRIHWYNTGEIICKASLVWGWRDGVVLGALLTLLEDLSMAPAPMSGGSQPPSTSAPVVLLPAYVLTINTCSNLDIYK